MARVSNNERFFFANETQHTNGTLYSPLRFQLLLTPSSQQAAKHILALLTPSRQPLGQQSAPIVHDIDHRPVPLILHHNVNELPRFHFLRNLRENKCGTVLSLEIKPHARALRPVVRVGVLRVLDEVPSSLAMAAVIATVRLERMTESPTDLVVISDGVGCPVEDGVGAHLRGQELLDDVVAADGGEGERAGPEREAGARHDLFAGGEDDFLGCGFALAALRR